MRIAIDTESRAIVTWQGGEIASLSMTRGDRFPLEVRFISGGKFSSLPDDASGRLMLKLAGAYAADPLAASLGWVRSGAAANTIYTFSLNLNTVQLNSALTGNTLELALEVEWSHGDTIQSSLPVSVVVARDYIQGSEGIPEEAIDLRATEADAIAGTNNEKWVSPLRAWDAIRAWANANFNWANLADKPSAFAPSSHKSSHATGGTDPLTPAHIGAVEAFRIQGNPPETNIAPAAMELRDNEDSGAVALKCDGTLTPQDNPWSVLFPDKFCTAIGAVKSYGEPPNENIAPAAMELRDKDDFSVALGVDNAADGWFVRFPDSFRTAIGAATAAQGAKADTSLQQGAYISAASLEVGSIAAGQTADLYVGLDGKVGVGTGTPTEKLTVSGHIDILGGQVKNLGAPVDATDAATKSFVDTAIADLTPGDIGAASITDTTELQTALAGKVSDADPRLTDARPPTAHKSSHATGGTDALTPEDIGAAPAFGGNPDVAISAMELRDNEDTGAVALKCDGVLNTESPEDNPWSVLFPDKFRTAIGAVKSYGNPPDENIAPAAMELRDKDDFSVALGVDNAKDGWFVRFPDGFRTAIGAASLVDGLVPATQLPSVAPALSAKSPLSIFIRLSGCPDTNFNTLYTYAGIFEGTPKYYAATGESLSFNSEEWVVETAEQVTKYFNTRTDLDPSTLTSGWKRVVGGSSLPVSIIVERVSPVPNKNTLADPVVQAATELRMQEDYGATALVYSAEDDSWHVHDADNFRVAIGAATGAQGAKADTSLQQGAYISAASLEVGSIAAGQTADLYVGLDGKVGVGTETPTEKLTVSGHIDLLGGQVKNLGAPVDATDAATKSYVDNLIPQAPTTGTYTLRSVDGVVSWVAA